MGEDLEDGWGDFLAGLEVIAAVEAEGGRRRAGFGGGHEEVFCGFGGAEGGGFGLHFLAFGFGWRVEEEEEPLVASDIGFDVLFEESDLGGGAFGVLGVAGGADGFAVGIGDLGETFGEDFVETVEGEGGAGGVDGGGFGFDGGGFGAFFGGVEGVEPLGWLAPLFPVVERFEDGAETVVIGVGDGVVAVVVALGAGDGEAHERGGDGFDSVGEDLIAGEVGVGDGGVGGVRGHAEEAGGGEEVGVVLVVDGGGGGVVGDASEFIAGELFCEEAVPRHV